MENYTEVRDKVISDIENLVRIVYPNDPGLLSDVMDINTLLMCAEPQVEFIQGMRGFCMWASMTNQDQSKSLTTLIHDLGEWSKNGNKDWFCPRTTMYSKYLTGATGVIITS